MKAEFQTLIQRVKSAKDVPTLRKLETLTTRVYDAGCLTPSELRQVDVRIMEKIATIENP
jgi:hypothetical protein